MSHKYASPIPALVHQTVCSPCSSVSPQIRIVPTGRQHPTLFNAPVCFMCLCLDLQSLLAYDPTQTSQVSHCRPGDPAIPSVPEWLILFSPYQDGTWWSPTVYESTPMIPHIIPSGFTIIFIPNSTTEAAHGRITVWSLYHTPTHIHPSFFRMS